MYVLHLHIFSAVLFVHTELYVYITRSMYCVPLTHFQLCAIRTHYSTVCYTSTSIVITVLEQHIFEGRWTSVKLSHFRTVSYLVVCYSNTNY